MKKENPYICDECAREVKTGGFYVRQTLFSPEPNGMVTMIIVPAIPKFNPADYDHHLCCRDHLTKHIDAVAQTLNSPNKVAA